MEAKILDLQYFSFWHGKQVFFSQVAWHIEAKLSLTEKSEVTWA